MLGANAAFGAQAALACDVCGLPEHAKHRAGGHAMILKTTHSTYRSWPDVRLVVGIVNTSTKPLPIDTTTPIWKQSSLHVGGVTGESFADVPIGLRATLQLAPGATYYFRGMGGRTVSPSYIGPVRIIGVAGGMRSTSPTLGWIHRRSSLRSCNDSGCVESS